MHQSDIQNLSQKLSQTEKTPELAQYWGDRYNNLLESGKFEISEKTKQTLTSTDQIQKPSTPYGNVLLSKHLDSNKNLDQVSLQSTVEIAVRLLDASLESIDFDDNSKYQTKQFRKIGIGVEDIQAFLENQPDEANIELIDRIGKIVSTAAYRASESLAMEKGVPTKWESIASHIRPKSFENWYNPKTREIKTGLEISQDFDARTIAESEFKIIPRRNSHLLLLPVDMEWQLWSDRDESAPITELDSLTEKAPEMNLTPVDSTNLTAEKAENDKNEKMLEIAEIVENQIIEMSSTEHQLLPLQKENHELQKTSDQETELVAKGLIDMEQPSTDQESEDGFLQGELVRFKNDSHKYIYQVVRKVDGQNNPSRYQLYGHQIAENELVSEVDLEAVNIDEILNFSQNSKNPISISLIYLSEDGQQVLVSKDQATYSLPKVEIHEPGQDLYATISEAFTNLYGKKTEVEAYTFLDTDSSDNDNLCIGVSAHLEDIYNDCQWVGINNVESLSESDYRLLELYVEHENYLHDLLEFNTELQLQNQVSGSEITEQNKQAREAEIATLNVQKDNLIKELTDKHQAQMQQLQEDLKARYETQISQLQKQHETNLSDLSTQKVTQELETQKQKLDQDQVKELEEAKKNLVQNELAKLESGETKLDIAILNHPAIQAEIDRRASQKAASLGNKLSFRASVASLKKITEHNQNS